MNTLPGDILDRDDIVRLVNRFYDRVRQDALLAPIFSHVDWPAHLPTMYEFWASLLLGEGTYRGNPLQKHLVLDIRREHFEQWLKLFGDTLEAEFRGPKADEALDRARNIASLFQHRMGLTP